MIAMKAKQRLIFLYFLFCLLIFFVGIGRPLSLYSIPRSTSKGLSWVSNLKERRSPKEEGYGGGRIRWRLIGNPHRGTEPLTGHFIFLGNEYRSYEGEEFDWVDKSVLVSFLPSLFFSLCLNITGAIVLINLGGLIFLKTNLWAHKTLTSR